MKTDWKNERSRRLKIQRETEGYLELGLPRRALDALARLGDPTRFDVHALYLWGEALRQQNRFHEAVMPLLQAADADPDNIQVFCALGWCYKRTGQLDRAISSLERALIACPTEPLLHYNLACYWSLAGNRRRAVEYLAQALEIDPDYRHMVDDEPDFDPVRNDPLFQALRHGLHRHQGKHQPDNFSR